VTGALQIAAWCSALVVAIAIYGRWERRVEARAAARYNRPPPASHVRIVSAPRAAPGPRCRLYDQDADLTPNNSGRRRIDPDDAA